MHFCMAIVIAAIRYAVQQLGLGAQLLQPLTAEQKHAVLAAMPLHRRAVQPHAARGGDACRRDAVRVL